MRDLSDSSDSVGLNARRAGPLASGRGRHDPTDWQTDWQTRPQLAGGGAGAGSK